jgi:hypothetical protein
VAAAGSLAGGVAEGAASDGVVADGDVATGSVGAVVVGARTGAPMSSPTTGALANGSVALCPLGDAELAVGATCVWVSETTGMRLRTVFVGRVGTVVPVELFGAAGSGGNGARRCTFGARRSGNPTPGNDSAGSGVTTLTPDACRIAFTMGATYQTRTSSMLSVAHQ